MEEYESILLVKPEVKVYRVPPRQTNRGVRAADWNLDTPDWIGRLRIVAKHEELSLKLEDKTSGELFARCPVDRYPGVAIEAVTDSSRYFIIKILDPSGRSAFVGMGFDDRGDAFDFNVAIQDHFKGVKQDIESAKMTEELSTGPKLDLSLKEGQTFKININSIKSGEDNRSRPKPRAAMSSSGTPGLLPPPPAPGSRHGQMRQAQGSLQVGPSSGTSSGSFGPDLFG